MLLTNNERYDEPFGSTPDNNSNNNNTSGAAHRGVQLQEKLAHISKLVDQLNSTSRLPHLNEDSLIRPEDQDQYAIKEEIEQELTSEVETLTGYMSLLNRDVQQCMEVMQSIESDSTKLHCQEPKECYSEAEEAAKKEYFNAVRDRDAAAVTFAKAQAVLDISRNKKFPGKAPVRQFPFPGAKPGDMSDPSQSSGTQSGQDKLDDEVDALISLGPLNEGQQ